MILKKDSSYFPETHSLLFQMTLWLFVLSSPHMHLYSLCCFPAFSHLISNVSLCLTIPALQCRISLCTPPPPPPPAHSLPPVMQSGLSSLFIQSAVCLPGRDWRGRMSKPGQTCHDQTTPSLPLSLGETVKRVGQGWRAAGYLLIRLVIFFMHHVPRMKLNLNTP